jgi:PAS domain S-box-containing protein
MEQRPDGDDASSGDITAELAARPGSAPDVGVQRAAEKALSATLVRDPGGAADAIVAAARSLCGAGSAGMSVVDSGDQIRWRAVAGALSARAGATWQRASTPCGLALDRNVTMLIDEPTDRLPGPAGEPAIAELLVVPFGLDAEPVGALWIARHPGDPPLTAAHAAVLDRLGHFAAIAVEPRRDVVAVDLASDESVALMVETATEYAMFMLDPGGHVATWNQGAERLLGYTADEVIGQRHDLFFTPEDRAWGRPEHELATARRDGRASDDNWLVRKGGTQLWASGITAMIPARAGHERGFAKIFRDLTERKQAEAEQSRLLAAIQESEGRLRVAIAAAGMGTWLWRIRPDEQLLDESLRRLMGIAPGEDVFTIAQFIEAIHPDDRHRVRREFERAATEGGDFRVDFRVQDAGGAVRWLSDQGRVFAGSDGTARFITGACMDITERRRTEEMLRAREQQLREADRQKDEFLALLAHELRNPLVPLRSGLELIELAGGDQAAVTKARAMMKRQLDHMVRLIDDLLDVSRLSQGKLRLQRAPMALADALTSAVEAARPVVEAAGHQLAVVLPGPEVRVEGDLTRLAQVFANLLTNSAKYTPRGGHVRVTSTVRGGETVVAVDDDGIGIPVGSLESIFDMFAQVDRSMERASGGLGIGLALVRGIVEQHGGVVEAASAGPGTGSTFTVRLPLLGAEAVDEEAAPAPAALAGRRILVVEDNPDSALMMRMMLELKGNQVMTASDGVEAVEVAETYRPEVILMDVGMPRLNGYDATRRIRSRPWGRGITIVALTGWGQEADRARAAEAGCDAHLVKPVVFVDLERVLGRAVH